MSHAHDQMWKRYGFIVQPNVLTTVIKAGHAKEHLSLSDSTREGCRVFDVPIRFNDGTERTVRCMVSPDLNTVVTVLPPVAKYQNLVAKEAAARKRIYKDLRRPAEEMPVTPDEEDEAVLQMSPPVPVRASTSLKDLLSAAYRTR